MIEIIDELRRLVEKLDEQSIDYALCGEWRWLLINYRG